VLILALFTLGVAALSACGGNKHKAQVRLLNVSIGYQSLDMYFNKNGNTSDNAVEQGLGYESLSDYASVDSGKYEIKFRVHGSSSNLEDISSDTFTDDSHATYVAYGSSGNFGTLKISEDLADKDSGKSGIQFFNLAQAGSLDVYLTDSNTALADATATFSGLGSGSSSSSATIDQGTYRLRVTGAGDKTDLRLDVASITFSDKKNATVLLTATTGGVLVNALYLPQQGTLTKNENPNARIRAATGVADGTLVSVAVSGASLLSNATSGVMSASYSQVTAGSAPVTLTVDSNPVTVANQTLTAGGDYTLLVWSNADGNQTTLISDDNHIPTTSSKLKLRILNGMSSLGDPVNLTANFSPVAQGVAVGQASTATEIDGGTNYELDVTDASSGTTLLSKTSVSLLAGDTYTFFVSGGGTVTVNGAIHKDAGGN
jgi:hypothetical protein